MAPAADDMTVADTQLAAVERMADDLYVVRLKEDVHIDTPGIDEIIRAVGQGDSRRLSILVLIPENADFDMAVMRIDHGGSERIKVMAVVAESAMFLSLVELYLRYFPQPFPVGVFMLADDAWTWLKGHPAHRAVA